MTAPSCPAWLAPCLCSLRLPSLSLQPLLLRHSLTKLVAGACKACYRASCLHTHSHTCSGVVSASGEAGAYACTSQSGASFASASHEGAGEGSPPRPSPKKRKAGVKSAATFSREQVEARWQRYQARVQQPDMQQLAATRAALPIASHRCCPLLPFAGCPLPVAPALYHALNCCLVLRVCWLAVLTACLGVTWAAS